MAGVLVVAVVVVLVVVVAMVVLVVAVFGGSGVFGIVVSYFQLFTGRGRYWQGGYR